MIIANELAGAGIVYEYEQPFVGSDGTRRYPDLTIEDADTGITWFWEHLGMLGDAEYDRKWTAKLAWYRSNAARFRSTRKADIDSVFERGRRGRSTFP